MPGLSSKKIHYANMKNCACGQPLHYSDPKKFEMVQKIVDQFGETIPVQAPGGTWAVPRHYIALHGLKAEELPELAKKYEFKKIS